MCGGYSSDRAKAYTHGERGYHVEYAADEFDVEIVTRLVIVEEDVVDVGLREHDLADEDDQDECVGQLVGLGLG
jgi:hypothetical protein